MSFGPGRLGILSLDNGAGAPTDISAYVSKVDADFPVTMGDTTTLGSGSETGIPVIKGMSKIQVSGVTDPAVTTQLGVIRSNGGGLTTTNASLSFIYGPMGSATGNPKYTGECFLSDFKLSTDVKSPNTWTAELSTTGDVTAGVY